MYNNIVYLQIDILKVIFYIFLMKMKNTKKTIQNK